jgi:hypothetical protein
VQFQGKALQKVLNITPSAVEIRDIKGHLIGKMSAEAILRKFSAEQWQFWVGVGNRRRIRYLRPLTARYKLNAGSATTTRVRNDSGLIMAPNFIVEHRRIPFDKRVDYEFELRDVKRRLAVHTRPLTPG